MILNRNIIITLQDFRRLFDFTQFWAKRRQFARDFHPNKIFYYNEGDLKLYEAICNWINLEDTDITKAERETGIQSLSTLVKREINPDEIKTAFNSLDFTNEIICISSGTDYFNLPGFSIKDRPIPSNKERLHKIEVTGENDGETIITIGKEPVVNIKKGECVYVTEIDGKFIRALPNKASKGGCSLKLINRPGQFTSSLQAIVTAFGTEEEIVDDVTQFVFSKGYFEHTNNSYLAYI